MQVNAKRIHKEYTHEGAKASHLNPEQALRRSVLSCMLFENNAYEDGQAIAERIADLIKQNDPVMVSKLAVEAREKMGLRHVPLLIVREMARLPQHKRYVSRTLERIITRPDQMCDFLALYWKDKRQPLSSKVKQGLAHAFRKFNEYQLAKYNRTDKEVRLRDVLFLSHAKPKDIQQADLWARLIDNKLQTPDTWEVALSAGQDKKETWERLMAERKLGALAFVRNLRNMQAAQVPIETVQAYSNQVDVSKVFPFQFVAAGQQVPQMEEIVEGMMLRACSNLKKLPGRTVILVDNSGSMYTELNHKSKMQYIDAASALAIMAREACEFGYIFAFSNDVHAIPPRRGFALRDAIKGSPWGGTYLGRALHNINAALQYERIIVITDEQVHDNIPAPQGHGYIMNVSNHKNGIGYGKWTHINGFSAYVLKWLNEYEKNFTNF